MSIFNRKRKNNNNIDWSQKIEWSDCWTLGGNKIKEMTDIDMLVDDED